MQTSSATLEKVLAILRERSRGAREMDRRMRAGEKPDHRQAMGITFGLVREALDSDIEELRTYAAAEMMDYYLKEVATDRDRQRAARILPVWSPSWRWVRGLESIPPEYLGPDGEEVFEALVGGNIDRRVQAYALAALTRAAKKKGDTADWTRRYAELERYENLGEPIPYLLKRLDPRTKIVEGNPVPPFTLALMEGTYRGSDVISDRALSGVAYVLQFWGTWCTPCVAEMPELHALWQRFGGPDFQIVSLSVDDSRETVRRFRTDLWSMPWHHVVLEGEAGKEIVDRFEVTSYPTTILVDQNGAIVSLKDADEGLATIVEALLASNEVVTSDPHG